MDIEGARQTAKVYVAVDPNRDPKLSTKILKVDYACAQIPWDTEKGPSNTASRRLSRGGKVVTVGVYFDGTQIGKIYYTHLTTSRANGTYNAAVSRWGGSVGTVDDYTAVKKADGTYCWDGRHIHVEVINTSGQSCYWSGLTFGRSLPVRKYLGYVGYKSPSRVCPSGI